MKKEDTKSKSKKKAKLKKLFVDRASIKKAVLIQQILRRPLDLI